MNENVDNFLNTIEEQLGKENAAIVQQIAIISGLIKIPNQEKNKNEYRENNMSDNLRLVQEEVSQYTDAEGQINYLGGLINVYCEEYNQDFSDMDSETKSELSEIIALRSHIKANGKYSAPEKLEWNETQEPEDVRQAEAVERFAKDNNLDFDEALDECLHNGIWDEATKPRQPNLLNRQYSYTKNDDLEIGNAINAYQQHQLSRGRKMTFKEAMEEMETKNIIVE